MKRILALGLAFIIFLSLSACDNISESEESSSNAEPLFLSKYITKTETPLTERVNEFGIEYLSVVYSTESLSGSGNRAYFLLIGGPGGKNRGKGYIAVEKVDKIFLQPVGLINDDSYLYLCNIDGDDDEEVIYSNGRGYHTGALIRYFDVTEFGFSEKRDMKFFRDYYLTYEDGFKCRVTNETTGFSGVFDNNYLNNIIYFKNGKLKEPASPLMRDEIIAVMPIDPDGDKVFDLRCAVHLLKDENDPLTAFFTLSFDKKKGEFFFKDDEVGLRAVNQRSSIHIGYEYDYTFHYPIITSVPKSEKELWERETELGVPNIELEKELGKGAYIIKRVDEISKKEQTFLTLESGNRVYITDFEAPTGNYRVEITGNGEIRIIEEFIRPNNTGHRIITTYGLSEVALTVKNKSYEIF